MYTFPQIPAYSQPEDTQSMKLTIVGGIHGAGKSSLCRALAPELGAKWISAGAILGSVLKEERKKSVVDVARNQETITQSLASMLAGIEIPVLLDGHFVLWKDSKRPEAIPFEYFRALNPAALLIVDTPVADIRRRLKIRDSRDYSLNELDYLRRAELAHGRAVSQVLDVPLEILPGADAIQTAREFLSVLFWDEPREHPPCGS